MIYLIFRNRGEREEKKSVHIEKGVIIGRGPLADISLDDDENISRIHTLVVPRPDSRVEVRDLSSKFGTFIMHEGRKKRLAPGTVGTAYREGRATLGIGDKFFVGGYEIEICQEDIIGEPTFGVIDDEDEITGIDEIDNLKRK